MHDYREILPRAVGVVLSALSEREQNISEQLQTSGATHLVKAAQAVQFAKLCFAVGVVATFEAQLKTEFDIEDNYAFAAIQKELRRHRKIDLANALQRVIEATNALKHGDGASYRALFRAEPGLKFKIKAEGEKFFEEGDISEMPTLVQADDHYLAHCQGVLLDTLEAMREIRKSGNS